MIDKRKPYTLRTDHVNNDKHYYVIFRDGQGILHEIEIEASLYNVFRAFEKQDKQQENFFDRHIEHSELTEKTLRKRMINPSQSIEEKICNKEFLETFWLALGELPIIQRRRFVLYYDSKLTYEQIAEMEGCTKRAIKFSVDAAKEKILEKLKKI